ncbi:transglutaminase-like domain-containing protein [Actinokineospora inagensis]|uniref:transglutaminase-like domain-containing protein n=1 Tax=Actinokineospora inagensis TaxID=103730 RepID=UPI001B7F95A4|nr:transglutaminase-like domain-containing protein [Actinokineospora inagensis]
MALDLATAGPFTELDHELSLPADPVAICALVRELVIQPHEAPDQTRLAENQLRPARDLVRTLLTLDPGPLTAGRPPEHRVIGTCRHFAVLACALLRYQGIAARARCGFATYFQPDRGLDHWIVEYHAGTRWIRLDPETLGGTVVANAHDLTPDQFRTGGEAWQAHRCGQIDAAHYGVYGTENFGPAEISGNAVRDLACLNKVETLPWDEWGQMTAAYAGTTDSEYDTLIDRVAAVCATDDPAAIADLYTHPDLRVPDTLIRSSH